MKEDYELQSDYIITPVDDMETLKRVTDDADEDFTPEEQEDRFELQKLVVTGDLIYKFFQERISFPSLPSTFLDHSEYKKHWLYLIQYEIYSKLLSRSSNKKQKVVIQEEELDELEQNEIIKIVQKETSVKIQKIWVGYCTPLEK